MPDFTQQRLAALYARVDKLERAVEVAGAFLERGSGDRDLAAIYAPMALDALKAGIVEDFRSSLLCSDDMTDEQLASWMAQIEAERCPHGHSGCDGRHDLEDVPLADDNEPEPEPRAALAYEQPG